ncbi:uncharacterized protein BP5553_08475 [Venustampulla echinocandica]|uniref:Uncharacterized protein n=1 Tax=Venustampulla echinocandica TaxID=2656787 RepID=A0A370TEC7_9HELO|nr:uncharacterized protein BP5553_08475 [Venustampulla echinocandica]RDL33036.1 hypothetical protein BP5553_08475 [Venustampulla echinocandica]
MQSFDEAAAKALGDRLPFRVFLYPLARDFAPDYEQSVASFIQGQITDIFQSAATESPLIKLLAVEIWGKRVLIVFDVNHQNYDWQTAHDISKNNPPIFRFKLGKDKNNALITRDKALDYRVNFTIADLHKRNGYSAHPPYVADRSRGAAPLHYNDPRKNYRGQAHDHYNLGQASHMDSRQPDHVASEYIANWSKSTCS